MKEDVLVCVNSRASFFETYCDVPEAILPEVNAFIAEITALGEASADAAEFEARFSDSGLSDKFNALIPKCTPKAYQMTAEDKAHSREVAKELQRESGNSIVKDIVSDVADSVMVEAEEELIARNRERMIENDTFDEYTRATNAIDDAKGFFGRLFGKKK